VLPSFATLAVFLLPIAIWAATGLGLAFALRRATSPLVLRLAATFAALWAFIATTALVAVIMMGGLPALALVATDPFALLAPDHEVFLLFGAIGAFLLFTVAFSVNQLVGWGLRALLRPTPLPWPALLERPAAATSLYRFASPQADAFSFTLLEPTGWGRWPRRHELILLSDGLLERLTNTETVAVIAHELGHVRDLDSRYLTFVRTFARMMRWDPVLAVLASSLTRHEEYRADDAAAVLTGDPRALARALYKVLADPRPARPIPGVAALLTLSGRRGSREAVRRIERLLALAETPAFREGRRG
jgi:Zn-dependent protease with chaperone function